MHIYNKPSICARFPSYARKVCGYKCVVTCWEDHIIMFSAEATSSQVMMTYMLIQYSADPDTVTIDEFTAPIMMNKKMIFTLLI